MPTKARRSPKRKQSRKAISPTNRGKAAKLAKQREKLAIIREREHARIDREYRRRLAKLEKTGLYTPKRKIGGRTKTGKYRKITKAQKAAIQKRYSRFEEFLGSDAYIFVPIPTRSDKRRKAAIKLAKKNKIATSPKGVFIPKTKFTKSAKAILNKKTGTYRIKIVKVKKGATGKKRITEILPIEPLVSIDRELERVKGDAELLKVKKDEALAYRVTLNDDGGYSWNIFQTPEQLRSYLSQGVSSANAGTPANRLQVFRSVSVMKVKRTTYFKKHPRPERNPYINFRTDKTGRSIRKTPKLSRNPRSNWMTPFEQGYAAYNSGFGVRDNPYPAPPEKRQWENGWRKAKDDDKA